MTAFIRLLQILAVLVALLPNTVVVGATVEDEQQELIQVQHLPEQPFIAANSHTVKLCVVCVIFVGMTGPQCALGTLSPTSAKAVWSQVSSGEALPTLRALSIRCQV